MVEQERVKMRIYVGDSQVCYQLITSRKIAEGFCEDWDSGVEKIHVAGSVDHCDGNTISFSFIRDEIKVVEILEIKSL